jgi:hypothetical protein
MQELTLKIWIDSPFCLDFQPRVVSRCDNYTVRDELFIK